MSDAIKAAEILARENEDRDGGRMHRHIAAFVERWAPEGRRDRADFDADLMILLRQMHSDAARPYEATMKRMLDSLPFHQVIFPKPEKP